MKMRKRVNSSYVIENYYREKIEMDTAHDARHLLSVLTSLFPDIQVSFSEKCIHLSNVRNHMLQKIDITWNLGV